MSDLTADVGQYLQAASLNVPPPLIDSDPLVDGTTPIEQLLRLLGLAANADDPEDNAEGLDEHARRDAKTTEAAEKFTAQDQAGAAQMAQMASGIAGALAGALGGVVQPLAQIPQQLGQGAAQALQTGLGMFGGASAPLGSGRLRAFPDPGSFDSATDDFGNSGDDSESLDEVGPAGTVGAGSVGLDGRAGLGGTAPTAALGAPPVPGPSASPAPPVAAAAPRGVPVAPASGMAGMPMFPPAMNSAAATEKDPKTDTKRVSVPSVRNGAPVQGRITVLPDPAATTADGRPLATRQVTIAPRSG